MILTLACTTSAPALCLPEECVLFEARELAKAGSRQEAKALCGTLEGIWEDECWFLVSDTLDLVGEEAFATCRMARSFERHCLGHALTRQAEILMAEPGNEAAALRILTDGFARHYPLPRAKAEAQHLVDAELSRRDD
ncbi:MAG TPA: hypothetical protein QGF58_04645 [Myxococcota bacterium]|nr:hypothetical protein [Myxococcota bacterium]